MANPTGRTYHYAEHTVPGAGGPHVLYDDTAEGRDPTPWAQEGMGRWRSMLRETTRNAWNNVSDLAGRHPVPITLVALAAGLLLGRGMARRWEA